MAEFFRSEARAALWRWREVLAGVGLALGGLWFGAGSFGLLGWLGWVAVGLGVVLVWTGWQRLRFGRGGGGPGVVQVSERRLAYLGPERGGMIDLDDLVFLDLDGARGRGVWVLGGPEGAGLEIPVDAEGADRLFDLFAALPGIRTERMLSALERMPEGRVRIWASAGQAFSALPPVR